MKILMINVVCGISSTGRICTDLAAAFEKEGHEVKIIYGRGRVPQQYRKYSIKMGNNFSVFCHAIKARMFDAAGLGSKVDTKRIVKWIEDYNPDVIHLHNIHGYYINIEELFDFLKKYKKKVIWTLHDNWSFTGHTAYCDIVNCKRWIEGCHECPLLDEYPCAFIDNSKRNWEIKKKLFSGLEDLTIVTPSRWLAERTKVSFLQQYKIKVINNGIDTNKFYPVYGNFREKYGIEKKFVLLGVASSWDKMKGYYDYLSLAERLGDEYVIVLVGLKKRKIKELPSNIIGVEKTTDVLELAEIYTAADLFLNLSYCENYPTVNIEAMACGTQVVTYKTGGSPETVENYGGYVIEKGDLIEVAKQIELIRNTGIEKLSIDKERFDKKLVAEKYLSLYSGENE